jgi:hypothetical protein
MKCPECGTAMYHAAFDDWFVIDDGEGGYDEAPCIRWQWVCTAPLCMHEIDDYDDDYVEPQ